MNLSKEYTELTKNSSERLQVLNKKAWKTCKSLLELQSSYEIEDSLFLQKSIKNFIQLMEMSKKTYYRKLDLLGEMLKIDLQLYPILKLKGEIHHEIEEIVNAMSRHYEQNSNLISKEG